MKTVATYGLLYRLTDKNYRALLTAIAEDWPYSLHDLASGRSIVINKDISDMTAEHAKFELECMDGLGK